MASARSNALAYPQLEAKRQIIAAMLQREGDIARQMRQTGLMPRAMVLPRAVTIRDPYVWDMPVHRLLDDTGGARIIGLMHHRARAVEHPMIRVGPLDPHPGLVAGDNLRRAKNGPGLAGSILNLAWQRMNMFISAPSLTLRPKASRNMKRRRSYDSA